ncbi:MAG: heparan-alpha-glucosaminide N-acetyltransferase [Ottowia sp.]|uniref:DUF1624 domain-containing protein n=1 Tax=Ottowia sp. TaxID=1898956 RepID=UPI003C709047
MPAQTVAYPQRFDRLDAFRGIAMVWMTLYHFSFDLNHFGYIHQNFYDDPRWTLQRTAIVSLFLLAAGMGQAVAVRQGQTWPRFWRRWAQVAGCALLVSLGSWWMFHERFIYFGVLHGMAVMLLMTRWLLLRGWMRKGRGIVWGAALIVLAFLLPQALAHSAPLWLTDLLNSRWLNWLGLITHKPLTEDYVPLLPWLGIMWWGASFAQWLLARHPAALAGTSGADGLAKLGRWSLSYYMLHQPILVGLFISLAALRHIA